MSRWIALVAGLLVGLLAMAPARLLLPAPPLAAARVDGSLWGADLVGARIGSATLGNVTLALAPAALLKGRLQWTLGGALTGSLWRSVNGAGGDGLSGTLAGMPFARLPVAGLALSDVSLALDGRGRCQAAAGTVQVQLATPIAGQSSLSGAARCDGAGVAVPLASPDGRVRLDLAATPNRWQARLAVTGAAPTEAAALAAAGFQSDAGTLVRQEEQPW
ncbi:type II secretion system protein N [Sandarakinorhabdus rubra]|uniref:type II secretion system protein N n=1 Tax=Sandarakinorhabdus rubra TaxID=2672568 RepID=UPI0013DBF3A9|nr:type II secretion system protein N [Sandarakinorhabdus rubra]